MTKSIKSDIHPVDLHVGQRIRAQRKALGVSQGRLAEALGLTFQQVQKYERGANRVSASKLWDIARALQVDVAHFFSGFETAAPGVAETPAAFDHRRAPGRDSLELAGLVQKLKPGQRRRVLDFIRALVDGGERPA